MTSEGSIYSPPLSAYIDQFGDSVGNDADTPRMRQNRDHAMQVNSRDGLVDKWTRDGRVFNFSNKVLGTPETMSAAGTAITLTAPSISIIIPSGLIGVLIDISMSVATVIAKSDVFAVVVSEGAKWTSGGEDSIATLLNAVVLGDGTVMRAHGLTHYLDSDTAIVTPALSNARMLKHMKRQGQASELQTTWNPEFNILKGDPLVYMKGPVTLLIFEVQETTAAEASWTGRLALLDPATITAS